MDSPRFFLTLVVVLAAQHSVHAVEYIVTNQAKTTPGGIRFNNELGVNYTKERMDAASNFIWSIFQQCNETGRKSVDRVTLFIDDVDGIAYAINNEIHVSADYINGITADIKWDFNGMLYHEMAHVWQWNGNGQAPRGLIEGIADFVRLKADYVPGDWVQRGEGDRWDKGYDVTARFLDYCNCLKNGFVADLNKKMRTGYSATYFVELLGKPVDQLWSHYKAKYGN